jgi:asparagine synthase (glutamine-hydrolysing)
MCGIAGILSLDTRPVDVNDVRMMCAAIAHRGPDDDGFHHTPQIAMGMRRLSIIDLHGGHQPLSNEDGTVWAVFNGEIYNYRDLRRQLIASGHSLRTESDTEVIVHLYEDYGRDLVRHLRGMFAFAVWDSRRRQLLLGRDRLGIKPLYYAASADRLLFASELKSILSVARVRPDLDLAAVNHLFVSGTTPATQSIVRGVKKLDAAHVLVARPGAPVQTSRYWDVSFEPNRSASEAELTEALREKVRESVAIHMVSDVPVGAFLSGGIDSSSVVAQMIHETDRPVKTFSIGFREEAFNELPYARRVAAACGTDHHELIVEPDVLDILDDLVWHLDEPLGDPSAIPMFVLSRLAADHVKVVLSGDGGDELFAGYDKYAVERRERRFPHLPATVRRALQRIGSSLPDGTKGRNFILHHSLSGWDRYLDAITMREETRKTLLQPDVYAAASQDELQRDSLAWLTNGPSHWLSAAQYLDLHAYLPLDILTKVDRMSMAHSLEARVPLLDHELVELAATIPPSLAMDSRGGKRMFKAAMRGIVPDEILDRPKRGFAVPLAAWFRGELDSLVRDLLLSRRSRERNIVNPDSVERLLDLHRRGRALDFQLWTLISFEMWCCQFLDQQISARVRFDGAPAAAGASL